MLVKAEITEGVCDFTDVGKNISVCVYDEDVDYGEDCCYVDARNKIIKMINCVQPDDEAFFQGTMSIFSEILYDHMIDIECYCLDCLKKNTNIVIHICDMMVENVYFWNIKDVILEITDNDADTVLVYDYEEK